ncbi:MAG: hypothetical protein ACSLEZ_11000 [Thiobacillus sp.]
MMRWLAGEYSSVGMNRECHVIPDQAADHSPRARGKLQGLVFDLFNNAVMAAPILIYCWNGRTRILPDADPDQRSIYTSVEKINSKTKQYPCPQ